MRHAPPEQVLTPHNATNNCICAPQYKVLTCRQLGTMHNKREGDSGLDDVAATQGNWPSRRSCALHCCGKPRPCS